MERNKSKEMQAQFLKEVLAEFDIETKVNAIAVRCFNDLLKSNKQAFDVIVESEKKLSEFETRLVKTQGFAQSIERNVANKIEIANNMNRRLQTFSTEFYGGLKEYESTLRTIRKDYDSLVASTQKNTYEIRGIGDQLRKNTEIMESTGAKVQTELTLFSHKINDNQIAAQKQFAQIRLQCEAMLTSLTQARSYFISKSSEYEQVSRDITLYKFDKESINRRMTELMREVEMRMFKSEFNEMRLMFDSRIVTNEENSLKAYSELRSLIREEKEERKEDVKNITNESTTRWKEQDKTNQSVFNRIKENRNQAILKIEQITTKQDTVEATLRTEINTLARKEKQDVAELKDSITRQGEQIHQNASKIGDCQKFMQERYDEMVELNSVINSLGEQIEMIIRENDQRKQELSRIEAAQRETHMGESSLGQSVDGMNSVLSQLQQQIVSTNLAVSALSKEVTELKNANSTLKADLHKQQRAVMEAIGSQKAQTQTKFQQLNRRINDVSIEIMNSLNSVEVQSRKYVDGLIESIRAKLQFLDRVNQQIQDLKKAFQEQMKQTQAVNQSISEKMEKANAGMTKFKSDLSLRVDAIVNEQQRRGLETKELMKQGQDIRKHLGYLTEGICVALSVIAYREFLQDNEGIKEIKISSLIEGWVLEIDEKQARYRGDHLNRRRLVVAFLNFFVFSADKIKGSLIESGKDIYIRMIEDSQEIFTSRKKGLLKKIGSELPKLHF